MEEVDPELREELERTAVIPTRVTPKETVSREDETSINMESATFQTRRLLNWTVHLQNFLFSLSLVIFTLPSVT